ncbi:hypothetical protein ACP4OV_013894 [Aristida adscensionis]
MAAQEHDAQLYVPFHVDTKQPRFRFSGPVIPSQPPPGTSDQKMDARDVVSSDFFFLFCLALALYNAVRASAAAKLTSVHRRRRLAASPERSAMAAAAQELTVDFEALSYISSLVEAFQAFDSDGDGLVTAAELRGLLASLGHDRSEADARDMLARAGGDGDGRLSVEELLDVMNAGELGLGALGAVLQSALPALEAAGGAMVGADELARAVGTMGAASAEDCAAIIECMDGDGDGAITIEEFRLMVDLL